jgi:hypothetical protein
MRAKVFPSARSFKVSCWSFVERFNLKISTDNSEMFATPCSIYETVQSAFAVNDLIAVLQICWADLARKVDAISESSVEQLLGAMSSMNYSRSTVPD